MSDYWNPIAQLAKTSPEQALQSLDQQMKRLVDSVKVRRVQRVQYHFTKQALGAPLPYTPMFIQGTEVVDESGISSGRTVYNISRPGYIIDITVTLDSAPLTTGWNFYISLDNVLRINQEISITTTNYQTTGGNQTYVHKKFDYGKSSGPFEIPALTTLGVSFRAINSNAGPDTGALVSVNVAHTGED